MDVDIDAIVRGAGAELDDEALRGVDEEMRGRGVDVAIEAAGHPLTCKVVQSIVGVGGRIANIGVYSQSAELHKESLWVKNITIRMGVVNTTTIPLLIKTIQSGKLDPSRLITHRFPFAEALLAYDIFANAGREQAVKLILNMDESSAIEAKVYQEDELVDLIVQHVMRQAQ